MWWNASFPSFVSLRKGSRSNRPIRRFRPCRDISWARSDPRSSIEASLMVEISARPGPAEDGEVLLDELLHGQLHIEGLDARDRPEGRGCLRDLVDPLDVLPDGVAAHGEIRRDRLRLAQLLGLPVDELNHPKLRLAVEDRPAVPFVGLRSRHDHVVDRRAGELVRDVARFVEDVLDEAEEVVPRAFDDDRVRDSEFLRIMQLELRDEAVNHGRGDDLPDLHRRSLATLSRYSWNALRLRPSTCVSPSRIVRTSRPIRRAILITASW